MKETPFSKVKDDYRIENDADFRERTEKARASLRAGRGIALEDVDTE